ncbi:hypothetical protein J5J86_13970 [Aquabacter sp. L1I39]|uniref:phage tail tube protein n=1 Tax=Aquabacter sp. L1I39 TaxID=2820278 RepID=UPI001AD9D84D|nr:phage tail tube protein [Aquabacter sp. L1I39]QTL01913.1 hypothetical protein J5J86_13970 [Aquabacter sp. L1I39]
MAKTQKLLIEFGDGESPEEFAFNCSINTSREFTIEGSTIDATTPNCVDPDAPAWVGRVIDTLSAGISGEGTMDPISWGALRDRMLAAVPFNARVTLDLTGAQGGGYFAGAFVMTSLGVAKEGRGFVSCSVELQSDGAITWTDAS